MESHREILIATTNSLSGLVDPYGRNIYITQVETADSQVFTVPIRTQITPAVAYRGWLDLAGVILPLLAGAVILIWRRFRSVYSSD